MNHDPVVDEARQKILGLWHAELRPLFRDNSWTPQEIYYARRLIAEHLPNRNHFLWDLKVRVLRHLLDRTTRNNPLSPDQWSTLSSRYYEDYRELISVSEVGSGAQNLTANVGS